MIFSVYLVRMVFLFRIDMISSFCQKSKYDLLPKNILKNDISGITLSGKNSLGKSDEHFSLTKIFTDKLFSSTNYFPRRLIFIDGKFSLLADSFLTSSFVIPTPAWLALSVAVIIISGIEILQRSLSFSLAPK